VIKAVDLMTGDVDDGVDEFLDYIEETWTDASPGM
jgi:uncharacterized protein YbdZ (MbtH family)